VYNLHCHSLLSDGALLPSELAMRHLASGYKVIAITDHADYSNIEFVVKSILGFAKAWPRNLGIQVLPGIELTHIPPIQFKPLTKYARAKGVKIIIGHGESPVEPVIKGSNRQALLAGVDILAHPGLIADEDIMLAIEKNIFLEITSRHGHSDTNQHVAANALRLGANLIINTDAHAPADIITPEELKNIGINAGLSQNDIEKIYASEKIFLKKKGARI